MSDLDDLPMHYPGESPPTPTGAVGAKPCRHPKRARHSVGYPRLPTEADAFEVCGLCGHDFYPAASRRSRNNGKRGRRAELDVARSIPGARKMGPLGLPWDVEVGDYARLQVKKLARRPGPAEVARLIDKIPPSGDRLRGFVWVEAAGQGRHGERVVWFIAGEFARWHGYRVPVAHAFPGNQGLMSMALDDWCAEFVGEPEDRAAARLG